MFNLVITCLFFLLVLAAFLVGSDPELVRPTSGSLEAAVITSGVQHLQNKKMGQYQFCFYFAGARHDISFHTLVYLISLKNCPNDGTTRKRGQRTSLLGNVVLLRFLRREVR